MMAFSKRTLKKLTRDFIVPLGRVIGQPPSEFDHVTRQDWKLEFPIQVKKEKKKSKK